MSHPPRNLFHHVHGALRKTQAPHPLNPLFQGSWSDSHAELTQHELTFLPYPPAAAALSDWFYSFNTEVPADLPSRDFRFALIAVAGQVHIQKNYVGSDPKLLERARKEVLPSDVSNELKSWNVPLIGFDCENLFDVLTRALTSAKIERVDFDLDSSPMGGSYLRWASVEQTLNSEPTAYRLQHLVFAILMEWSMDLGGNAPYAQYHLTWTSGRIHLQCTPDCAGDIPEGLLYEVLEDTPLPGDIDRDQTPYWILSDLEGEHPELHASIQRKAQKLTIAECSLDRDITDILKGTPNLPWGE